MTVLASHLHFTHSGDKMGVRVAVISFNMLFGNTKGMPVFLIFLAIWNLAFGASLSKSTQNPVCDPTTDMCSKMFHSDREQFDQSACYIYDNNAAQTKDPKSCASICYGDPPFQNPNDHECYFYCNDGNGLVGKMCEATTTIAVPLEVTEVIEQLFTSKLVLLSGNSTWSVDEITCTTFLVPLVISLVFNVCLPIAICLFCWKKKMEDRERPQRTMDDDSTDGNRRDLLNGD